MSSNKSRTLGLLRTVGAKCAEIRSGSVIIGAVKRLTARAERVVRNSYAYCWLTKDPDPNIIVIDLRETRTVGPFLRLLEKGIEPLAKAWGDSWLVSATTAVGTSVADSRTGRLLATLLEPPEPPERQRNDSESEE
jgi:hypothetical protein